jgi:hypothetical protein
MKIQMGIKYHGSQFGAGSLRRLTSSSSCPSCQISAFQQRRSGLVQPQHGRRFRAEGVGFKVVPFQAGKPKGNECKNGGHGEALVCAGVWAEVRAGQFEQGGRGAQPVFLQMDECARQLNEPLVEIAVGPVTVIEPKLLQNIVGLIKLSAIEAVEITLVKWVKPAIGGLTDHARNSFSFVAHQ